MAQHKWYTYLKYGGSLFHMHTKQKERARVLREGGASMRAIAASLGVSKASISRWCHDIVLSTSQRKRLTSYQRAASIAALRRAAEHKKEERIRNAQQAHENGKVAVGALNQRDFFITGLALYWGEGSKKGRGEVEFTNAEPASIVFMVKWFQKVYGIPRKDFTLRITINTVHRPRIHAILGFWSHLVHISTSQFTKTSFITTKQKRKYQNHTPYYGTLHVRIKRSTDLRRRILGSIEALKQVSR